MNMELGSAIGEDQVKEVKVEVLRREFYKSCQECEASPKWLYLELRLELEDPRVLLL